MAIGEITEWLKHKDYNIGMDLYKRYSPSKGLLAIFLQGKDEFNEEKLEQILRELNEESDSSPSPIPSNQTKIPVQTETIPEPEQKGYPAEIVGFIPKRKEWYSSLNYLKPCLDQATTDPERLELALQILALERKIMESYQVQQYFNEHGSMPGDKKPIKPQPVTDVDWHKQLLNVRSNITKAKKRLATQGISDYMKEKAEKRLKELLQELSNIENKLNG